MGKYGDNPDPDEERYERNLAESIYWKRKSKSNLENKLLIDVARIALRRFPELERGESVGVKEIRIRLRKIRELGYPVKPYSKMGQEEAWNYLQRIKSDLREYGNRKFPDIIQEINEQNRKQREDAYRFR